MGSRARSSKASNRANKASRVNKVNRASQGNPVSLVNLDNPDNPDSKQGNRIVSNGRLTNKTPGIAIKSRGREVSNNVSSKRLPNGNASAKWQVRTMSIRA